MTPDEVQANIIEIVARRAKARPIVRDLEIAAGRAKADYERRFAVVRANADGSVAERDAVAHVECAELRDLMISAMSEFNYAKGLLADLSDNQMAWQSVLKNMLAEIS
jgi:hypothetical protein